MNKKINFVGIVIILSFIFVNPFRIESNETNPKQLDISKALPQNSKIISHESDRVMIEGEFEGVHYRIGVNTILSFNGQCLTGLIGPGFWKDSAEGLSRYYCDKERMVDGFTIPLISGEIRYFNDTLEDYKAREFLRIATSAIVTDLYNQVYAIQNPEYPLEKLNQYGDALEIILSGKCRMPKHNTRPLLQIGPNAGGCSPYIWPKGEFPEEDSDEMHALRANLLDLLSDPGCEKDYVGDYLVRLASDPQQFEEDLFIKNLSCAGDIAFEKGKSEPE